MWSRDHLYLSQLGYLLKIPSPEPTLRPTKSDSPRAGPGICILHILGSLGHTRVWDSLDLRIQDSDSFSEKSDPGEITSIFRPVSFFKLPPCKANNKAPGMWQICYRTKELYTEPRLVASSSLKCLCLANSAVGCALVVCSAQKEQRDRVCR